MTNYFRMIGLRGLSFLPPVILIGVMIFFYSMYMHTFLWPMMKQTHSLGPGFPHLREWSKIFGHWNRGAVYFFILHFSMLMFVIAYLRSVFTNPGDVPSDWNETKMEEIVDEYIRNRQSNNAGLFANLLTKETVKNVNVNDKDFRDFLKTMGFRYCDYCKHFKPERTHHCRQCGSCVLKMDHHCNWLYNCIGYRNYKFFMVFLLYTNFLLLFMFLTYTECISNYYMDPKVSDSKFFLIAFAFFLNMSFVVIIFSFTSFHFIYLVSENRTTLEFCEKSHKHMNYNSGFCGNWVRVFGKNPLTWFLPICPNYEESPVNFEPKAELEDEGFKLISDE